MIVYTIVALLDEFLNEEQSYGANGSGLLEKKTVENLSRYFD